MYRLSVTVHNCMMDGCIRSPIYGNLRLIARVCIRFRCRHSTVTVVGQNQALISYQLLTPVNNFPIIHAIPGKIKLAMLRLQLHSRRRNCMLLPLTSNTLPRASENPSNRLLPCLPTSYTTSAHTQIAPLNTQSKTGCANSNSGFQTSPLLS
jgi:hypothetical protein